MKANFILPLFLFCLFLFAGTDADAQSKKEKQKAKAEAISKLLDSKQFVFKPQTALPLRGGSINLTSDFDLVIKNDTLKSYLPYYGRAFASVPYGATRSPLSFTTTDFKYTSVKGKKGSRQINIEVKDKSLDVRKFYLDVSEAGYATLQTSDYNRDPITFNGYIEPLK